MTGNIFVLSWVVMKVMSFFETENKYIHFDVLIDFMLQKSRQKATSVQISYPV